MGPPLTPVESLAINRGVQEERERWITKKKEKERGNDADFK